jgi:ABC-type multidrug transport system ATPase subunit
MEDLDLTSLQHTRIGDERTGGLSRGQKRRVTVAIELITSPSVIFLDEPTSSLDAYSSLKLMQLLQKLAHRGGRTIICTIHQV